jgi:hypothetical protein
MDIFGHIEELTPDAMAHPQAADLKTQISIVSCICATGLTSRPARAFAWLMSQIKTQP